MSVIIGLKFIHFLSIILAGGITIGGAIIQRAHMKAGIAPALPVMQALRTLSLIGLAALILLWITGIGLAHALYEGLAINTAFTIKLAGASLLLLSSLAANYHLYHASQTKRLPNPLLMKRLQTIGRVALLLVLGGVSIAFTG